MAKKKMAPWIIILVFLVFFGSLGFAGLMGLGWMLSRTPDTEAGILEIQLRGPLREGPSLDPFEAVFSSFGVVRTASLWDLRRILELAANDSDVLGLRLDILGQSGWATADEIISLVEDFRSSGKPVFTYLRGDFAGDQQYYMATAGDQVWLPPTGGLIVNGLRFEVEFWKGTLEKLHVEPSFLMLEEYKSAGEVYTREQMSDAFREQLTAIGEDIQNRMISVIAERRNLAAQQVQETVDRGLLTAPEALDGGWVDRLGFVDELREAMAEAVGEDQYTGISLHSYMQANTPWAASGERVALIFGEGEIFATGGRGPFADLHIAGDRLARTIEEAAKNDQVEAIVFRVDSPGGSVVGSDHIWRAIEMAQEKGKPVVVSFSDVAGSGGYWIAMGADRILAQPTTITGSIGVVFGKFNIRGFYEWIGANVSDVTLARNADLLSAFEPMAEEHEERVRAWMGQAYDEFRMKVADGRKIELERVGEIAKGRIWSGEDALEIGLVDQLGGLGDALALARELADLSSTADVEIYPKQKGFFELLSSGELGVVVGTVLDSRRGTHSPADWLEAMAPEKLRELSEPRPWALMPPVKID